MFDVFYEIIKHLRKSKMELFPAISDSIIVKHMCLHIFGNMNFA